MPWCTFFSLRRLELGNVQQWPWPGSHCDSFVFDWPFWTIKSLAMYVWLSVSVWRLQYSCTCTWMSVPSAPVQLQQHTVSGRLSMSLSLHSWKRILEPILLSSMTWKLNNHRICLWHSVKIVLLLLLPSLLCCTCGCVSFTRYLNGSHCRCTYNKLGCWLIEASVLISESWWVS